MKSLCFLILLSLASCWLATSHSALGQNDSIATSNSETSEPIADSGFTIVVAKEAGLWPQIHIAKNGTLLAFGYNAPAHTTLPGDVDCWASRDEGKTWQWRSTAAPRPADHANYCHWASGTARNGDSIVVVSGVDHAGDTSGKRKPNNVVVFRSTDSGKTWNGDGTFPELVQDRLKPYPYGSIVQAGDQSLRMLAYTVDEPNGNVESSWMFRSEDDGRTWVKPMKIADGINEAVVLPISANHWLCVARTVVKPAPDYGQELRQFRSSDDGATWLDEGLVAGYHQHPPHLLRLSDGRMLLTYCNRQDGTIVTRLSNDEAAHWSEPRILFQTGAGDRGYPSTVQLPSGRCITVFYAIASPLCEGYHMGAIDWLPTPPENRNVELLGVNVTRHEFSDQLKWRRPANPELSARV